MGTSKELYDLNRVYFESVYQKEPIDEKMNAGLKAYLDKKKAGKTEDKEENGNGKNGKASKGSKPDFLDLDKDGNKTEPMKSAAKSKKSVKEGSSYGITKGSGTPSGAMAAFGKAPRMQKGAMAYDGPNKAASEAKDRIMAKTKAKREGMKEAMMVTNADKKGNTPAYQGYKAGKKNVKTGEPLYKAAPHMKEETAIESELLVQDWKKDDIKFTEIEAVDIIKPEPLNPSDWRTDFAEAKIDKGMIFGKNLARNERKFGKKGSTEPQGYFGQKPSQAAELAVKRGEEHKAKRGVKKVKGMKEEVKRDEYGDPVGGPKISKKQKAKNLASNTPDEQHTTTTSEGSAYGMFKGSGKPSGQMAAFGKQEKKPNPYGKRAKLKMLIKSIAEKERAKAGVTKEEAENIDEKCWKGYEKKGMKTMFGKRYPNCVKKKVGESIVNWRDEIGYEGKDEVKKLSEDDMKGMSVKSGHKRPTKSGAGMTKKGVEAYRRRNPGSKLQTAVTTKPSKLKKGSKAANRRKSYCARSAGQMKKFPKAAKDPNSRLRQARRRWNC